MRWYDWDDFTIAVDDEAQTTYVATDASGEQHHLDEEAAGRLLDSLNGLAAPTVLSALFLHPFERE